MGKINKKFNFSRNSIFVSPWNVVVLRKEKDWYSSFIYQVPEDLILVTGHEEKPYHLYMYHHGILFEEEERYVDPRILEMQKQLTELHKMAGRQTYIWFYLESVFAFCRNHVLSKTLNVVLPGICDICLFNSSQYLRVVRVSVFLLVA